MYEVERKRVPRRVRELHGRYVSGADSLESIIIQIQAAYPGVAGEGWIQHYGGTIVSSHSFQTHEDGSWESDGERSLRHTTKDRTWAPEWYWRANDR